MPIVIFNLKDDGNMVRAVAGETVGTVVAGEV